MSTSDPTLCPSGCCSPTACLVIDVLGGVILVGLGALLVHRATLLDVVVRQRAAVHNVLEAAVLREGLAAVAVVGGVSRLDVQRLGLGVELLHDSLPARTLHAMRLSQRVHQLAALLGEQPQQRLL